MTPRINKIVNNLGVFGSQTNSAFIASLSDITHTTEHAIERDQSIELLLYCEANENGPLGMAKRADIVRRFSL